jgi:hypothetical protein
MWIPGIQSGKMVNYRPGMEIEFPLKTEIQKQN